MNTLDASHNFLGLAPEWSSFDRARVVVLPIAYEQTTSYGKGAGEGPQAILDASRQVELYDEELEVEIYRLTQGVATLPIMRFGENCRDAQAVESIRNQVHQLIRRGKLVVALGGEHTIAVGAAKAHAEAYADLSILQLDAHSDLRREYEGNAYSHASAMARIYEFHQDIVQVGIRSQCQEEANFIKENRIQTFYAIDLKRRQFPRLRSGQAWHDDVIERLKPNVYVTFDCDFLDPSLIPALGTPEPGGFGWDETMAFLKRLSTQRRIVGFDVNELAPIPSLVHPQFTIAKLIYKWIGYMSIRSMM
jgi:agmatinase